MNLLIQRVSQAKVTVSRQTIAKIDHGLLVFVSFGQTDTPDKLPKAVHKLTHLRIFSDHGSKFNHSALDVDAQFLVVSQFTLHSYLKGHRPSFTHAAPPQSAKKLYHKFIHLLQSNTNQSVQSGRFGANMQVSLTNDGPVTIFLTI